jgi:hypothetical protein
VVVIFCKEGKFYPLSIFLFLSFPFLFSYINHSRTPLHYESLVSLTSLLIEFSLHEMFLLVILFFINIYNCSMFWGKGLFFFVFSIKEDNYKGDFSSEISITVDVIYSMQSVFDHLSLQLLPCFPSLFFIVGERERRKKQIFFLHAFYLSPSLFSLFLLSLSLIHLLSFFF